MQACCLVTWIALGVGLSYAAAKRPHRAATLETLGGSLVITGLVALGYTLQRVQLM